MPPKKKREDQTPMTPITFVPTKMSTRSSNSNKDFRAITGKVERLKKVVVVPKASSAATQRKVKATPKAKLKKGPIKKKKSEVISEISEVITIESEGSDEEECTGYPIEQIFLEETRDNDNMETSEVKISDGTCEISEQLESLSVVPKEHPIEDPDSEVVTISDSPDITEPVINFDNFEQINEEIVTEEFVPIADDTEVVIEETVENLDALNKMESNSEEVSSSPSSVQKEEKSDTVEDTIEEVIRMNISEKLLDEKQESEEKPEKVKLKRRPPVKKSPKKTTPRKKEKPKAEVKPKQTITDDKTEEVRRSSRIKSISVLKQRSKGRGLVKSIKPQEIEATELSNSSTPEEKSLDSPTLTPAQNEDNKPVKVKSRWRRSSELEMNVLTPATVVTETCGNGDKISEVNTTPAEKIQADQDEIRSRLKQFIHLKENLYLTDRLSCKEAKNMTCDCFLTPEELDRGELGCGEDCLNRLLMIECGNVCPLGDRCTNKKFQKGQFAPVEVFKTEKKGLGLRAAANIPYGEFILEYVGEVLDHDEFDSRVDDYSNEKNKHYYFMALRADGIIDATVKGNISRFINHSCEPNAETQKWTVNGELRIGFFSTRTILAGEEVTFDYRFERYGKEAQKCFCETPSCRGWLGEEPEDEEDEEEEEEDEEDEEEEEPKETAEILLEEKIEVKDEAVTPEVEVKVDETKEVVEEVVQEPVKKEKRKRVLKKKPRKDLFEDLDQLDDEIEVLVTTGLKNQAHTLKLSRLMVRAKEPGQRAKLLRVLRRGELPCRRLFLDYHGLRLMHGYMMDVQDLIKNDKKYDSFKLEILQTLATLPIPNKTMLQDSKVLPTVEKWSSGKNLVSPTDSDSSPQTDQDASQTAEPKVDVKENGSTIDDELSRMFQEDTEPPSEIESKPEEPNYEEEITSLAQKLLEEWSSLKEVFKIPKKERIEQMKEHEREANRGYIAGLGLEQDSEKKNENRYRISKRYRSWDKVDYCPGRKVIKLDDRNMSNYPTINKFERRKMFALQVELREEERRRKQREMWRQHEQHCILLGTDPRLTAPFDPNRGYQCIWNPQIGQWQNYPIQNPNMVYNPPAPLPPQMSQMQPPNPSYPYMPPTMHGPGVMPGSGQVNQMHALPTLPYQEEAKSEDVTQVKFMGPIPPPAKLPPKWKCAKDKYGRPYYYHIRIRKSQWEPPPLPERPPEPDYSSDSSSSSDTSSLSSSSSSSESDSDDDMDDTALLIQVKHQIDKQNKAGLPKSLPSYIKSEDTDTPSPLEEEKNDDDTNFDSDSESADTKVRELSKEEEKGTTSSKRKRSGLVQEIIISPRTEEDRLQFKEDLKRYKMNKEKLKKEKEIILQQKKQAKEKRNKTTIRLKMKEMNESNTETAKKIKESFRSNMATVVVSVLNAYRKPDCKEGRITNTEEFKHLARKLTHFVMLKEMKHIEKIEELVCTDNVKAKAREYIRKYMSKFGEVYQKRNDEPDFY